MGANKPLNGAKAPFLKLVSDEDRPAVSQDFTERNENPEGITVSHPKISPSTGTFSSYALRLVAWKLDSGAWALGVLKEYWPSGKFLQGEPTEFRLWQCREFSMRSLAEDQIKYYIKSKTLDQMERELIGKRGPFEESVPTPPVVAEKRNDAPLRPLPFARPPMSGNGGGPSGSAFVCH